MKKPKHHLYKNTLYLIIGICFWLFVWQLLSYKLDKPIFLPSFTKTFGTLFTIAKTKLFLDTVISSFTKIISGFFLAVIVGTILSILCSILTFIRVIFEPLLKLIKAIPVASFIILSLLWVSSNNLSVLISFLMVLPVIYINMSEGINKCDKDIVEVIKIFKLPVSRQIRYVYLPTVTPYFLSGCKIGMGFCFKSGIAAEIIGLPPNSIGRQLYDAKLYLMTDELFAWTIVIVIISALFEFVFIKLLTIVALKITNKKCKTTLPDNYKTNSNLESNSKKLYLKCDRICKTYDNKLVLNNISLDFTNDKIYCITAPSGYGKTTLMRIICGLSNNNSGEITTNCSDKFSYVFQEDRLFENISVYANIKAVYGSSISDNTIISHLKELHIDSKINSPVNTLSGGMKRRCSIIRAILSSAEVVIMDEPFKGIDDKLKIELVSYIKKYTNKKIVIIVTHDINDIKLLNAQEIKLEPSTID